MGNAEKSYERGQVLQIINSVINKMEGTGEASPEMILQHIAELAQTIDKLKREVGETRTEHLRNEELPDATDELDAVVAATAEATDIIMTSCEDIQKVADKLEDADKETLFNETTKIYEACSFQDITGQRITKVVKTLKTVDEKITALLKTLSAQVGPLRDAANEDESEESGGDERLLNGPQMPEKAVTQDDIDKLLAEFD